MTMNANPDPVNRWATEHYGFEKDAASDQAGGALPPDVRHLSAGVGPGVGRRTVLFAAGSVLGMALIGGISGIAVADDGDRGGPGAGPAGGGRDGAVTRSDGEGRPDGGRR